MDLPCSHNPSARPHTAFHAQNCHPRPSFRADSITYALMVVDAVIAELLRPQYGLFVIDCVEDRPEEFGTLFGIGWLTPELYLGVQRGPPQSAPLTPSLRPKDRRLPFRRATEGCSVEFAACPPFRFNPKVVCVYKNKFPKISPHPFLRSRHFPEPAFPNKTGKSES